jgi:phosphomevalonate kinase
LDSEFINFEKSKEGLGSSAAGILVAVCTVSIAFSRGV